MIYRYKVMKTNGKIQHNYPARRGVVDFEGTEKGATL